MVTNEDNVSDLSHDRSPSQTSLLETVDTSKINNFSHYILCPVVEADISPSGATSEWPLWLLEVCEEGDLEGSPGSSWGHRVPILSHHSS